MANLPLAPIISPSVSSSLLGAFPPAGFGLSDRPTLACLPYPRRLHVTLIKAALSTRPSGES